MITLSYFSDVFSNLLCFLSIQLLHSPFVPMVITCKWPTLSTVFHFNFPIRSACSARASSAIKEAFAVCVFG